MVKAAVRKVAQDMARARRQRRTRAAVAGTTIMIILILVAVYRDRHGTSTSALPSRPGLSGGTNGAACESQTQEPCADIRVHGRTWRYALLRAPVASRDTVLVEFGGPGLSLLSGDAGLSQFSQDYKDLSSRYNILAVEEPWVTQELSAPCASSLSSYYIAIRSWSANRYDAAAAISPACGLDDRAGQWGFDPKSYANVVESIINRDGLTLRGFIGHSWGSVRLSYLAGKSLDWSILVRPYPVSATQREVVDARVRKLDDLASRITPIRESPLPKRSVPVTRFDQYTAVAALAYATDTYFNEYADGIVSGTAIAEIAALADQFWGRFDATSISPSVLARIEEVCAVAGSPPAPTGQISVRNILIAQYAACNRTVRTPLEHHTARNNCVVAGINDAVVPYEIVAQEYRHTTITTSRVRSHGSFDGLSRCIENTQNKVTQ